MALTLDEEYDLLAGAKQIDQEAANQLSIDREYDMLVSGGNKDYVAAKDIQRIPQQINALGGLPVGGEPMVGGPDILAQEQGQTKTFMEGPNGKPVEVRRAQAIDISGKVIPEPISPDGMDLQFRGDLIKQKTDELKTTFKLPFKEYRQKSDSLRSEIQTLKQKQQEHESKQIDWLRKLVTEKSGVSVPIETGIGQEYALDETKGKTQEIPIGTRKAKAEQIIRDKNLMIDDIIGNDKFINYALDKNFIAPQYAKYLSGAERLAGKLLNEGESADVIESLKRDPKIRELAEQWALTTPTFMQSAGSIFQNAWDSYSQTLGSSNVGAVGLALESLGATQLGQSLVEAADYADQQRKSGQDPRKANAYIEFAKDVTGGIGSSAAFLVTGTLGRSMMSTLGVTSERAINLLTKGNILTFGGLSSAWQGYSEARNDGATDEQAKQVALFSAMTQAPLELLSPLEKWIGKLDSNSKSRIYKGLSKAAEAIIDGTDEALFNEAPQQIAGNLVKKYVYDPNQDIFDGAGYSAATGGAAGIMTSILVNMISGKRNKTAQKTGNPTEIEKQDIETQSDQAAEELSVNPVSDAAARMTKIDQQISDLKEQISSDEELLQQYEEGSEERKIAERAINQKRIDLENLNKQFDEAANGTPSKPAQVSETITPTDTKESIQNRLEELNKEFDALDEADIRGQDRVNKAIFAEQNKLAQLTAIEQGVEPQGTTPTREMGLPLSGRRSPFGTFYPDRPVLQAFIKATDKVLSGIQVTSKRAQKLKNAIRTGIANNAGFLAGTNTEVISSEAYSKLTGTKPVSADTGTYIASFFNGKKYLVIPNINQLTGISIQGEQRAASKDAALDQEARAAVKKIEEEIIHLSMFQGIQDEYKALKKPKLSEQEYIVKRISDIAKEVKRTNPNALPRVSEVYLTKKNVLLDDMTFSQEFMRMVIQRVRTGQITEDLNAIRKAEQEAFSDQDKGAIISLKNSILNALQFLRNSIARYLGKGTSTKEVKKMEDTINNILDEYGIVKGEANYEFKDYSAAQPKGEVSLTITPTEEAALEEEAEEPTGATYGREEQIYDVFGGITRKPVSIPKPAELPSAPTIEEQTAETTYGGQTGVFDVFAGARRKPVVTEEPPVSMVGKQVIPGVTPVPVVAEQPKATKEAITAATNAANQIEEENKALEKLTKFNPPSVPTLQDARSLPDAVAKKGKTLSISGGKQERNILDPKESKKRFDDIGYERKALELPEDMNDRVSGRYGSAIANIKSLYSLDWLGAHFHGGVAVNPNVKGTQRGRIVAHELGHASHSLLGDRINKDQNVLNELQAIEELLYPGLRAKVSAASNPDASFFNYLLSPNELIAEFNVERISNTERAIQVAPTLSALLESAEKMKGLVADRKTFPTVMGVIRGSKERLKVKDLESREIRKKTGDILKTKQWSDTAKFVINRAKKGELDWAKIGLRNLKKGNAPKEFAKRTVELTGNQELIDYVEELYPAPTEVTPTIAETLPVTPEAPAITPAPVAETPAVAPAPAEGEVVARAGVTVKVDARNRSVMSGFSRRIQKPKPSEIMVEPETRTISGRKYFRDTDGMWKLGSGKPRKVTAKENENDNTAVEFIGDAIEQLLAESDPADVFETLRFNTRTFADKVSPSVSNILQATSKEELVNRLIDAGFNFESTVVTDAETNEQERMSLQKYAEKPIEAKAALYVQDIEVFDRNGENRREKQIVVEANSPEEAAQLVRTTPEYQNLSQKSKAKKLKFFTIGQPRLKRGAGESGISARAGVTPDVQYSQAIQGDNGNDPITPKTNQDAWANNNPRSERQIQQLINQKLDETGHLFEGNIVAPMYKAASKDFDSANGEIGSFFAETEKHAKDYLDKGMKIFKAFIKMVNPASSADVIRVLSKEFPKYANQFKQDEGDWGAVMSTGSINDGRKFVQAMLDAGYDGVYQNDGVDNVAVVFNPNQAKSADLVTFDNKGNVIPISERFNPESPLMARAGVTPKPSSKISKVEREVTQQVISDIESMINDLDTGKDTSGKPYESKTAQKGKKYAYSLVSPFSQAINLFTTTTHKESLNAFNKVLKGNPDASFFDITSNLTLRDANGQMVVTYGLTPTELSHLIPLLRVVAPTYRQMIMDSDASFADRTRIALSMPAIEYGLSKATATLMQTGSRILNAAKQMRQFGGYGFAVANYKSKVVESIGSLWSKVGGDMADVAEAVRGDRRKAVDNVFNLSRMISKAVSLQKMAVRNPEKARQSIRNAVSKKQNRKTKEILLEFCANTFGEDTEKFANMIIDQTAQAILAIGSGKKNISTDSTYKKIYNAISLVAKQTAQEEQQKKEGKKKREVKPREGKFLQQVAMVIGNDNTYKQFMDELKKSIRREYQNDAAFNDDFKSLFEMLSTRQWSEKMRTQAIKDSADALNYKFADLFSYIGSKRTGAQADVKAHITSELKDTGASPEMIDKFISDVDSYLNDETMRVLEKKLGFQIDEKTKKIRGGQVIKENMQALATAEGQFKFAKTLKGLTRLAASDQRNFLDKLNELIITELGFDEATSNELSKYIDDEISKAIVQQQSDNLKQALERANKTLADNNIKRVGTQRTLLKRLIEMANMGQLDDMKVYEAFRQTHNFSKGYLEYNPEFVHTLREWGDRISSLPEGVLRGIEEQKLGRHMLEKGVFTTTDYLSSYWYFSLLSQTGTQAMNVLGSTFNLLGNIAVWAAYTKGKSVFPMMKALNRAILGKQSPASNAFLYVMQTGLNPSGLQDEKMMIQPKGNLFENATPDNTPKLVYNFITFGGGNVKALTPALNSILNNISPRAMMRFMKATDAYMREVAYEVRAASLGASEFSQEQFDAAMRQAEKEMQGSKSSPKEKKRETLIRVNEILSNQKLDQVKREFAEQDALEVVYSQKPAGFIGWLASVANKALEIWPVTRLFIPFTNVCANVLNENLNYAPFISQYRLISAVKFIPLLKGKIELRSGAERNPFIQGRSDKAADIAIKSSIGLVASALPFIVSALAGGDDEDQEKERPFIQFYSQGPKDPEQNKIWSENGGIKYSIRIGNTYVSYLYTPLVIPLSYGQMLKESFDDIKKKAGKAKAGDITEIAVKVTAASPAIGFVAALDQSFLTGVSDLIELKEAKDIPKAGAGIVRNIVSRMLTPGVARDMQKLMIDEKLEGDLYITNMLKEFPGSSAFLDKDLNYFGDPARYNSIMEENGFTRRAFSLIGRIASSETPDQAFQILYKNGITPPKWDQSLEWFDKTPMNKAEQREFVRAAGPLMRQFIIDNEFTIEQIEDTETAQKFISNGISAIRAGVKSQLQAERQ